MIYILDTTTTGSGLDIYFRHARSECSVLVTDDYRRYLKDINRDSISRMRSIGHDEFEGCLKADKWPLGRPSLVVSNSDKYLLRAAAVSKQLGLPSPAIEDLELFMRKDRFRAKQRALELPCPEYECMDILECSLPSTVRFPLICKPAIGTGSVGVKLCHGPEDLSLWVDQLKGITNCRSVLLEEYIVGPLYSVEAVLQPNSTPHIIGFTNRELGPPPFFVETMYTFPVQLPEWIVHCVQDTLSCLSAELRTKIMVHMEFVVDINRDRVVVIEVNPRLGGGMLARMISEACSSDIFDTFLSVWEQIGPSVMPRSGLRALSHGWRYPPFPGVIDGWQFHFAVERGGNILEFSWLVNRGDRVDVSRDFKGPIFSLLVVASNSQLASDVWRSISAGVDVSIKGDV